MRPTSRGPISPRSSPLPTNKSAYRRARSTRSPKPAATPSGTVSFLEGSVTRCPSVPLDASGQASCDVVAVGPIGAHSFQATFTPSTLDWAGSAQTTSVTVNDASLTSVPTLGGLAALAVLLGLFGILAIRRLS